MDSSEIICNVLLQSTRACFVPASSSCKNPDPGRIHKYMRLLLMIFFCFLETLLQTEQPVAFQVFNFVPFGEKTTFSV